MATKLNLEMGGAHALGKEAEQVYSKDKEKTGTTMSEVEQLRAQKHLHALRVGGELPVRISKCGECS